MVTAKAQVHDISRHAGGETDNTMQGTLDSRPWYKRAAFFLARALPSNWKHVIVNENVDSVTMPKWVAVAVLGTVLTFGVQSWWARSNDHDTLVEIRTELKLAKEANKEKEETFNGAIRDLNAWKEVMNGNQKLVIGMLSAPERDVLDKQKNKPTSN